MSPLPFPRTQFSAVLAAGLGLVCPVLPAASGDPLGSEFRANTVTSTRQSNAAAAMDADGDFVVVWSGKTSSGATPDEQIYAQRYGSNGLRRGQPLKVNTTTTGGQRAPDVAMDAAGRFVVAWQGGDGKLRAQRYGDAGLRQGGEFVVSSAGSPTAVGGPSISVDMSADGAFAVAWTSTPPANPTRQAVFLRRYGADGKALGGAVEVAQDPLAIHSGSAVAVDADGDLVVIWSREAGGSSGLFAQRYGRDGQVSGSRLRVDTLGASNERVEGAVDMDASGNFVVAWNSYGAGTEMIAQRFDAAGGPLGEPMQVNADTAGFKVEPSVAVDADGDFTVAWQRDVAGNSDAYARRYGRDGLPQGAEFRVNVYTSNLQTSPQVAMDADGDLLFAWDSHQQHAPSVGVYARRYSGPEMIDLALSISDKPDPVSVGDNVRYGLRVLNQHPPVTPTGIAALDQAIGAVTGLRLAYTTPAGAVFMSATGSGGWSCTQLLNSPTVCNRATPLAAGASDTLTLEFAVPSSPQHLKITANTRGHQFDADLGLAGSDNVDSETTTVRQGLEFATVEFLARESDGAAVITVRRTGGSSGTARVSYASVIGVGGNATVNEDYTPVSGVLNWASGDAADKTFVVPLINDQSFEFTEALRLRLSTPAGAPILGVPAEAFLSIDDDDPE